ncbi:histidine phosphatase family protein [Vagococcus sp.]|uniref:histidine phosphatase family protein n=1 Tax=Vagococcus sp. TaxID=1933889 RepID=UPI003F990256
MAIFYCIRHGKTEFNQNFILQGGLSDSPLLEEGYQYAKQAGTFLKDVNFDCVIASPQKRAHDTAESILSTHPTELSIETINNLRELEFGEWDGLPQSNFEHFEQFSHLIERPDLYDPSDFKGESFQDLLDRTIPVFKDYTEKYPDGKILVVSHGLTLLTTLSYLTGTPIKDIRKQRMLDNVSISTLEVNPENFDYQLKDWNNISHY